MVARQKAIRTGILFIALLVISGVILMYRGNDAVVLATQKKDGIITAEQIKLSFDSVGGRLINEAIREGQQVKAGEVVMEIDATDINLTIEKIRAQIAQLDAQINSTSGNMTTTLFKANNDEQQSFRQIDSQRGAVNAAKATLVNAQIDYKRKEELFKSGAIAKAQLDDATMTLNVAQANVETQQQLLDRLLSGIADTGNTDSLTLPTIQQERAAAENIKNDIAALAEQKKMLEVQLKEAEVAKGRLTLRAPEDGKILSVLQKQGEMIAPNTPVILLETNRVYYDIYLSEEQAVNLHEGDKIIGRTVADDKEVSGTIRLLTQAPGFADLRQTREKGQSDLSAFQVRIYIDNPEEVLAGQTITVEPK
ncbi:MAG: HlyD family efflux transporter periplasmic adaptor subunit [Selenomonadaceae bacterium]|nr:HlyD family efflux transporter periplasmic adaptor subunit [Selenomonadaceae bacterium]